MFRRHPESRLEWTSEKAAGCALRQREILDAAAVLLRPGGRLVYSTCTWNPAENEEQVASFLARHPEFDPEPFSLPGADAIKGMFTCWIHRVRGEGQFVACLRKKGNASVSLPDGSADFRLKKEAIQLWRQSGIQIDQPVAMFGQTLVNLSEIPDLKGIQVLRLGLHLGIIRGNTFFPDHAASHGLIHPEMPEMKLTEGESLSYLSGEALPGKLRGWTLMTWNGLVLGWAKGSDGWMKNHYPKGLRNKKLTV